MCPTRFLIDRLYDPRKVLQTLQDSLNLGGVLIISLPYSSLDEFTDEESGLAGIDKAGEPFMMCEAPRDLLRPHFVMLDAFQNSEFVIRETRRKSQRSRAELTAYKRPS